MVLRPIEHELKPTMGKGKEADEYIKKLLPKLEVMRKVAKQNVEEYQQRYKKQYDKNSEPSDYAPGTRVLLYNPKVPPGKTSKLWRKFQGPYYVTMKVGPCNYILRDCKTHAAIPHPVHADRLKRYTVRNMFENRDQSTGRDGEQSNNDADHSDEIDPPDESDQIDPPDESDQNAPAEELGEADLGQDRAKPKKTKKRREKSPGPRGGSTSVEPAVDDESTEEIPEQRESLPHANKDQRSRKKVSAPKAPRKKRLLLPRSNSVENDSETNAQSMEQEQDTCRQSVQGSGSAESDAPAPSKKQTDSEEQELNQTSDMEVTDETSHTPVADLPDDNSGDETAEKGKWYQR